MSNFFWDVEVKGGEGSGHHDHLGRPGQQGGSLPSSAGLSTDIPVTVTVIPDHVGNLPRTENVIFAERYDMADWRNDKWETAIIVKNGKYAFEVKGDESAVRLTKNQLRQTRGSVVVHNHPTNGSFSQEDIDMAFAQDLEEIRVITPGGYVYRFRPTTNGHMAFAFYGADVWEESYDRVMARVASGELTEEQGQEIGWHEFWSSLEKRAVEEGMEFQYEAIGRD